MNGIQEFLTGIGGAFSTGISDIEEGFGAVDEFFTFLNSPDGWMRIFEVLFGGLLIIGAFRYGK